MSFKILSSWMPGIWICPGIECVSWLVCPKERKWQDNIYTIYTIFNTVPFQVRSITHKNNPLQSGSVFYERAKLTGVLYKHRVIFTVDGRITKRSWLKKDRGNIFYTIERWSPGTKSQYTTNEQCCIFIF